MTGKNDSSEQPGKKNAVSGSDLKAGGNITLGDQIVNIFQNGAETPKKRRKFPAWLKFTVLSIGLVSVSVTVNELILIRVENPVNVPPPEQKEPIPEAGNKEEEARKPLPVQPKKPAVSLENFVDIGQSAQVAMLSPEKGDLPVFHQTIEERFSELGLLVSDTYFRPAFRQKFGKSVEEMDLAELRAIGLTSRLNCICQVSAIVQYEPNEVEGIPMVTARGRVLVKTLNLSTGRIEQISLSEDGAGISENAALSSLDEALIKVENLKFFSPQSCK